MLSSELTDLLLQFRRERDWEKFHTPKNLSAALVVEAGELLEIFQWVREEEEKLITAARRKDIEREIADITILLTYLCHDLDVSLSDCVRSKLVENAEKYPADKAFGVATKYNLL